MRIANALRLLALILSVQLVGGCASIQDEKKSPKIDSRDLELMLADAQRQNLAALKSFETSLANLESSYIPKFASASNSAADKASELEVMLKTVYHLARDRIYNLGETDAYLQQNIGPILEEPVAGYARDVEKLAAKLEGNLRAESVALATKMQSTGSSTISDPKVNALSVNDWSEFEKTLQRLGYDVPKSGIRLALGATTLVGPVLPQLVRSVGATSLRAFGTVVPRLAAAIPALANLSIAEGPAVFFKALSAAGFLWTAYDLKQLQPRYREDILGSTRTQLNTIRSTMNVQARDFGKAKITAFDKLQKEIQDQAIRRL